MCINYFLIKKTDALFTILLGITIILILCINFVKMNKHINFYGNFIKNKKQYYVLFNIHFFCVLKQF